jgi:hypothetical protein
MAKRSMSRGARRVATDTGANGGRGAFVRVGGQVYRGLRGKQPSGLLRGLAARVWSDVTDGAGVVLVDGVPVPVVKKGGGHGG